MVFSLPKIDCMFKSKDIINWYSCCLNILPTRSNSIKLVGVMFCVLAMSWFDPKCFQTKDFILICVASASSTQL